MNLILLGAHLNLLSVVLIVALALSLAFHAFSYFFRKTEPKKRPLAMDARQLLHDLSHGGAVVRVTVIDPDGLMVYRGGDK